MASASEITCCGHQIPVEIITAIFKLAITNPIGRDSTRLAISLVAKSWHRALYQTPSLWNVVTLMVEQQVEGEQPSYANGWSFLRQALVLSHPLPIDIYIDYGRVDPDSKIPGFENFCMAIRSHLFRWRSFTLIAPGHVLEDILKIPPTDIFTTKTLHTMRLLFTDDSDFDLDSLKLTHSLRHLAINFLGDGLDKLNIAWSGLVSLHTGFGDMQECRHILLQATSLRELRVDHIGSAGSRVEPFTLMGIQKLEIDECALHAMHDKTRLPNLKYLALTDQEQPHTFHSSFVCAISRNYFGHALRLLNASRARIRTLKIGMYYPDTEQLLELLRLVQGDLMTLQIGVGSDTQQIFALMENKSTPLLPKLQSLVFCDRDADIFFYENPFLEQIILSRWRPAPEQNIPPLKSLVLESTEEPTLPSYFRQICAGSSLAHTILQCRNEGLQVQWTHAQDKDDIDDILERASKSKAALTRF